MESVTQGINEETVMLQCTLTAGGIDTIMYTNQPRFAAEHSPTQGNLYLLVHNLQRTRLPSATDAEQTASIDNELRHASGV